jgi:polyhydroxyalkanoate synthesis repressor PhaR
LPHLRCDKSDNAPLCCQPAGPPPAALGRRIGKDVTGGRGFQGMSVRRTAERVAEAEKPAEEAAKVAIVKKYANRRLYNTATSSYVTLEELSQMVRDGEDFVVYDAKTGEDITRSVLTQIILEEDSKGRNLLPISFLRQLISFYDDQLHAFLPRYLEVSMENFARHQDQMRAYIQDTFGRFFPYGQFEDLARQNLALFTRAATMFRPGAGGEAASPEAALGREGASPVEEVRELKQKVEQLEQQLDALNRARRPRAD